MVTNAASALYQQLKEENPALTSAEIGKIISQQLFGSE